MGENNRKRKYSGHEGNTTVKGVFKRDDFDDSLSTSDWNLVIDENPKPKKQRIHRIVDEQLDLICHWAHCNNKYHDFNKFHLHIKEHLNTYCTIDEDIYKCFWENCTFTARSIAELTQHVCFHCYHVKLTSIGQNVEKRNDLPECISKEIFVIPPALNMLQCEWKYCNDSFLTHIEFFEHLKVHVYHNPKTVKDGPIICKWKGCKKTQFAAQYKLAEHIRMHTKEKVVACPTCGHLFASNTKFCDHRKRQIPLNLQSYLCSQCSKFFPSERLLRDHMRLHVNQYKCSMCEMTCPKPSILAKHIRYRHLTEKPYKCPHCSYRGVSKHNIDLHLKTHDPEKAFKCTGCNFECRSSFALGRHIQKKHGNGVGNIYECHNCKKRFGRGGVLTKHLMKAHKYHWPSGHSRFRYKEDQDGIFRLQTVRYETLDVTEEIMKGQTVRPPSESESLQFKIKKKPAYDNYSIDKFEIEIVDKKKKEKKSKKKKPEASNKQVLITIADLDSKGNILKSQVIQSSEIICTSEMLETKPDK